MGLDAINSGNCCNGLYRLLNGVPTARRPYNACTLGFAVAPRLNASGRMSDASLGVELFLCRDPNRADEIIARLNKLNELRQQDEANILNDAIRRLEPCDLSDTRAIVLRSETWNAGVIGIAASRIAEMYHRPTILFSESDGILKGSARSIDGVNIHEVLCCCREFFVRFGGHAKAAGITMESAFFEDFRLKLNACLKTGYDDSVFIPCKRYEFDIPLEQVTGELIAELTRLAPFGESNPSPVFRSRHVAVSRLRRFGSDAQHTKMDVSPSISSSAAPLDAVWFASAASYYRLLNADTVDILYTPGINNWNGFDSIQLRVVSAKAEQPRDIDAYIEKVCAISATACLKTCLIGCPNRSSSRKYAKQPSPSFVPALYPVCLCLFFLLNPPKRFLTKFAAVKSAMLTFVTLALRIHPFAATPFCLHRSLQICLHSGSARSFSTTIPLAAVFTRRFHAE